MVSRLTYWVYLTQCFSGWVITRQFAYTVVHQRKGNSMVGLLLFNVAIQNRWEYCKALAQTDNRARDPWSKNPVRYPLSYGISPGRECADRRTGELTQKDNGISLFQTFSSSLSALYGRVSTQQTAWHPSKETRDTQLLFSTTQHEKY